MTNNNDPNSFDNIDSWDEPGVGAQGDGTRAAGTQAPSPSFFTFWRCCGCLAAVGVLITIGSVVAFKMALDSFFEVAPLDFPVVEVSEEQATEIADRLNNALSEGEPALVTPEELTVLFQHALSNDEVPLGQDSRALFRATPDGLLEALVSLQMPEGDGVVFWFIPPGRFVNIRLVGSWEIEDGEFTDAKFAHFRVGPQEGADYNEEESRKLVEEFQSYLSADKDLQSTLEKIQRFRFDGQNIELQLVPGAHFDDDPSAENESGNPETAPPEGPPPEDPVVETPSATEPEKPAEGGG